MKITFLFGLTPCSDWGEVPVRTQFSFTFSDKLAQGFLTGFTKYLLFAISVQSLCKMWKKCQLHHWQEVIDLEVALEVELAGVHTCRRKLFRDVYWQIRDVQDCRRRILWFAKFRTEWGILPCNIPTKIILSGVFCPQKQCTANAVKLCEPKPTS